VVPDQRTTRPADAEEIADEHLHRDWSPLLAKQSDGGGWSSGRCAGDLGREQVEPGLLTFELDDTGLQPSSINRHRI
jgi:hypothetical protein